MKNRTVRRRRELTVEMAFLISNSIKHFTSTTTIMFKQQKMYFLRQYRIGFSFFFSCTTFDIFRLHNIIVDYPFCTQKTTSITFYNTQYTIRWFSVFMLFLKINSKVMSHSTDISICFNHFDFKSRFKYLEISHLRVIFFHIYRDSTISCCFTTI